MEKEEEAAAGSSPACVPACLALHELPRPPHHPPASSPAAGRALSLTLMHCDIAAVPVAIDQRVLGPAPLVGAHAAAADHLLHAIGELALQ